MPLPDLIEIIPCTQPVRAEITVPGSKSITNRALVLAALAAGETKLTGALWSEDTQVMVEALRTLGFKVEVQPDPLEFCNRTITVAGLGGRIPNGGSTGKPLDIFVGNAGTAARFLAALLCLGPGAYRLHGVPRMHGRPQQGLFSALWQLGYTVDPQEAPDRLPVVIFGEGISPDAGSKGASRADRSSGRRSNRCTVSIEESSQFASALLLCSAAAGWQVTVEGDNPEESPYVRMTTELMRVFPKKGGTFEVEPDASSGSYFIAAGQLLPPWKTMEHSALVGIPVETTTLNSVSVAHWPVSGWQIDQGFQAVLQTEAPSLCIGLQLHRENIFQEVMKHRPYPPIGVSRPEVISRARDLGDSIMTAIVLAPFSADAVEFTDLGRLRLQECERVQALRTELTRCGARVEEARDTLKVYPSRLHGAEIETYNDHRVAMCFAILGLKVPGIKLKNPACVKKTFPNFFQKLAAAPPQGLGAAIRDVRTGRNLAEPELFAD